MATTLGLTTVEVLLALVIFAVGALGAGGLATGLRATAMGSHQAEAARAGGAALGELVVAARRARRPAPGSPRRVAVVREVSWRSSPWRHRPGAVE